MCPQQDFETAHWFETEIQPHEPELRRYLHSMTARDNVDDLVQETYIRLLRSRLKAAVRIPRGLLFAIARNAARDVGRRERVAKTFGVAEIERLNVVDEARATPEIVALSQETLILREAIQSLPERCRTVLILRKIQNLSQKEIALRMGISVKTVEVQLTKALQRCGKYMKRHADRPERFGR